MDNMILFIAGSLLLGGFLCLLAGRSRPWIVQAGYAVAIVSSVAIASKIVALPGGLTVSASIGLFSATFLMTDYLSEVFGKKAAMRALLGALAGYGVFLFATQMAVLVTPAEFWAPSQEAFATTFGSVPRIMLASIAAFALGQFTDINVFHFVKSRFPNFRLFGRNNISTFSGQTVDSIVFYSIGFYGIVPNLVELIVVTCLIKYAIALIDTPVLYLVRSFAGGSNAGEKHA